MELAALIKEKITQHGAISIADYMALCLSHPDYGYYMRRDPLGAAGDFITSPEISQIFGELIGLWFAAQWEKLGRPEMTLCEFGPGRGTLMSDLLRATKKIPGFHEAVSVRLLEISPVLKQKQWHALAGKHSDIEWIDSIDALPEKPLLLVANEFFDALPVRQFVWKDDVWRERMIDYVGGQFSFVVPAQAGIRAFENGSLQPKDGDILETCAPALDITQKITAHIATHGGAALIIDYGYTEGKGDTLQAMKNHAYHDILSAPGEADLTAHVDFAAIKNAAQQAGGSVFGPTPQGKFLMKIGAGQRIQKLVAGASQEQGAALMAGLERLASPDHMGDLFKVLAIMSAHIAHAEGF